MQTLKSEIDDEPEDGSSTYQQTSAHPEPPLAWELVSEAVGRHRSICSAGSYGAGGVNTREGHRGAVILGTLGHNGTCAGTMDGEIAVE
jgi:hypothetical protein